MRHGAAAKDMRFAMIHQTDHQQFGAVENTLDFQRQKLRITLTQSPGCRPAFFLHVPVNITAQPCIGYANKAPGLHQADTGSRVSRLQQALQCFRSDFTAAEMPHIPSLDDGTVKRGVGIRFKDRVRTDIEEYCISEGWVRVQAGKTVDRKGNPLTIKLTGPVEAWYEDLGENPPVAKKG